MRFALGVEYDGTGFLGWQKQQDQLTVQSVLESALSRVADHSVTTFCAGRTDAGVHALGQVVHFETESNRPLRAWLLGTNTYLPATISVQWIDTVDENFHARFSAVSRSYKYFIHNIPTHSALTSMRATWYRHPLNAEHMHRGAQFLLGENDFSSFRSSECESNSPMRCVHSVKVVRHGDFIVMDITANAFLHHMVRNIMGVLIRVGEGRYPADWVHTVLQAKDRRLAAETASPTGLYLYQVAYPTPYAFKPPREIFFI
ncbi:MAG: tRNA pseudouridine(38-40) synthase TruA [Gammaproteobacteria bacterium]|nr:tRNA pseudouridine(38-40) synthase TruA [Gammaproteobacteria bacterium]